MLREANFREWPGNGYIETDLSCWQSVCMSSSSTEGQPRPKQESGIADTGREWPKNHSTCFHLRASEYQRSHSISQHPWSIWLNSTFLLTRLMLSPTQIAKRPNWKNYQITSLSLGNFLFIWNISLKRPDRMYWGFCLFCSPSDTD